MLNKTNFYKKTLFFFSLLLFLSPACTEDRKELESPVQATTGSQDETRDNQEELASTQNFSPETVYFSFDSDHLAPREQEKLSNLSKNLSSNKNQSLVVEGHCDERGTVEYNLALGERRANAVKRYLIQLGISSSRLSTISYGKEQAVVNEHNESAWSQNRRAEFKISQ